MMEMLVRIGPTNATNYDAVGLERSLAAWEEVQAFFAEGHPPPLLVERTPEHWYEISVNAAAMLEHLRQAIAKEQADSAALQESRRTGRPITETRWYGEMPEPAIRLRMTPRAGAPADQPPLWLAGRFLQQLFLAMNIATPGSCNLDPWEDPEIESPPYPHPRLNADILDDAFFDALEEGWPELRRVSFGDAWNWLHRDMAYDIEVATEPTQKALFGLLRICTREQWDPDNTLVLSRALEGLLAPRHGKIALELQKRLELIIGSPPGHPQWLRQFYNLRSGVVHGSAPIIRPGENLHLLGPETRRLMEEAEAVEGRAVAVLLALLQDMVRSNTRAYRFGRTLIREPW
jgi:hypothetical protein